MTACGPRFMCKVDGTMDQHLHKQILQDELFGTIEWYDMNVEHVVFQWDNDQKHRRKVCGSD
jgi:hypothetical protein